MTIPYDIIWIIVALVVIFFGTLYFTEGDLGSAIGLLLIASFLLFGFRSCTGFTAEDRARIDAENAENNKPVTTKQPMSDGCFLYYHYGNGRKQAYTTKFVKCENAVVTTERQYSCGTGKTPKTCTENVVTQDNK